MTSKPVALGLILCDYLSVEEGTRKVSLAGTFGTIRVDRFPAIARPFYAYSVLTDGMGTGMVSLEVTRLDTGLTVYSQQNQLTFADRLAEAQLIFHVNQLMLPAAGWYQFALLVDGEWTAQRRIRVHLP